MSIAQNNLSMLEAYNIAHKYEIICRFICLNPLNDKTLSLNSYKLTRADHTDDVKKGGVCMHCKENLSLRIISTSYFDQCLLCEVSCQNQKGYNAVIYRSVI